LAARRVALVLFLSLSFAAGATLVYAQAEEVATLIQGMVERLRATGELQIEGARIASSKVLPEIYEHRSFQRLWTKADAVRQLREAIAESGADGLDPRDYHHAEIEALAGRFDGGGADAALLADLDVLLTDALIRLGYHVLFGKVDPEDLDPNWNLAREIDDRDPGTVVGAIIEAGNIREEIERRRPQQPVYGRLKAALARYRELRKAGGWKPVPAGPTLRLGMDDDRIAALRRRLAVTGDLAAGSAVTNRFDEDLLAAVKLFQSRHYFAADGVIGSATIAALNVPVEDRIDQIRVNLERARWLLHDLPRRFILVDIAGFQLALFRDGAPVWTTRVQVGKPFRKTPVFRSDIKYLVFNPTWTVPPGILTKDILPAVKRDAGYLSRKKLRVVDRHGKAIDPATVAWSRYPGSPFPYQLVQGPGPDNALGRVKFIFPNPHLVFLHDTPSRSLFDQPERAFSSGCIRVEKPLELAALLLQDSKDWNEARIDQVIESGETSTVFLPEPVPVLLLYWTTAVDDQGQVRFKKDLYDRDARVLKALNGEFRFRRRPIAGRSGL
jgi:murein L,D-transpeptidase YcbB/YkuD